MACNTETKQIGDREYSVTQWPPTKSMLMKMRLIKTFGASFSKLIPLFQGKGKSKEVDLNVLSDSLSSLFENSTPEEVVELIKLCITGVACDGTRLTATSIDSVFSPDELLELYQVFLFVLQVNYKNFLKGQLAGDQLAKVKEYL